MLCFTNIWDAHCWFFFQATSSNPNFEKYKKEYPQFNDRRLCWSIDYMNWDLYLEKMREVGVNIMIKSEIRYFSLIYDLHYWHYYLSSEQYGDQYGWNSFIRYFPQLKKRFDHYQVKVFLPSGWTGYLKFMKRKMIWV